MPVRSKLDLWCQAESVAPSLQPEQQCRRPVMLPEGLTGCQQSCKLVTLMQLVSPMLAAQVPAPDNVQMCQPAHFPCLGTAAHRSHKSSMQDLLSIGLTGASAAEAC